VKRLQKISPWSIVFFLTIIFIYLYVFMEWVFFVTKPSFMSGMSLWVQSRIFILSSLGWAILPLLLILLFGIIARVVHREPVTQFLVAAVIMIPSLIVSSLILLLVDNFTYTVLQFGIVSTERLSRAAYGFLFLLLCGFAYYRINLYTRWRDGKKHPVKRNQWILLTGLLSLSGIVSLSSMMTNHTASTLSAIASQSDNLPNIILLGSDGLDATHLSAYGYERDTTPNIKSRLSSALVAENAFPNAGTTAGSVASILTGKLPIETRLIYPPDILNGDDSYQHLPGILKRLGYHTIDLSVPYFGDALTLNMQGGFDIANQRSGTDSFVVKTSRIVGGGDTAYFVNTMLQRISERLLHIFYIKPMINPFETVIEPARREDEQKRFDELISVLETSVDPVFVHVHMLGTHGPRFEIRQQVFSAGQSQEKDWMMDFYDDAILSFDRYVDELFDYLMESGKLENTIVIVYSDHGRRWTIHQRIPLIFWFPHREYTGVVQGNVQNIDIAPTILSYLGVPIPEWMKGESLIAETLPTQEHIFSASVASDLTEVTKEGLWAVEAERRSPPFYQLGYVGLVVCNQWYELYVQNPSLRYGKVKGHTGSCDPESLSTPDQAEQILLDHLFQNGYDVSAFPKSIPVQISD
jgi:glucan phosphoethanolaminetransferase (alkaline phosphatase superfamily)